MIFVHLSRWSSRPNRPLPSQDESLDMLEEGKSAEDVRAEFIRRCDVRMRQLEHEQAMIADLIAMADQTAD